MMVSRESCFVFVLVYTLVVSDSDPASRVDAIHPVGVEDVLSDSPHQATAHRSLAYPTYMDRYSSLYGNVYAVYAGGVSQMLCYFRVPPLPQVFNKTNHQNVYLWCGVEPGGHNVGVLQPVLMYGPDCNSQNGIGYPSDRNYSAHPYWYFSAQYVFPKYMTKNCCVCETGPVFKASPGDLLISGMQFVRESSTWLVSMMNTVTGDWSILTVAHPYMNKSLHWKDFSYHFLSFVDVETYNISNIGEEMPPDTKWTVAVKMHDLKGKAIRLVTGDWKYHVRPHKQPVVKCTADRCLFNLQAS